MSKISSRQFCFFLIAASGAALGTVLIGQYGFGLRPCHLCIFQRIPFGVIIVLGALGLLAPRFARPLIALSGLAFLIDGVIAVYHSGVERKWWAGLEGCSSPDMSGSIEELMKRIQETAVTRCDEIAWQMFGLSLANYNVAFCLVCTGLTFAWLFKSRSLPQG